MSVCPSSSTIALPVKRFVGFDIAKRSCVIAAVDVHQQIVLAARKVSFEKLAQWCRHNLTASDAVVLEATTNAWYYYDLLKPLVGSVVVANPNQVKLITQSRVKTDARDALALARLLAAELVPTVWVPPVEVRELRALIAHRTSLIKQRTQARTRLQAILATHQLLPPSGDPFSAKNASWWQNLALPLTTKLLLTQQLALLEGLAPLISQTEQELIALSTKGKWASQSAFLLQLPGLGVLSAMTILAAIGDITRFASAKALVGYAGLGASIYASGKVVRTGAITKQGRTELRTTLVEAAWTAVEHDQHWHDWFERLSGRIGRGKAIVAVARKLLVVIWHVLSKQLADQKAEEERVASKIQRWSYKLRAKGRNQLTPAAFTRQELNRLGLAQQLTTFKYEGRTIKLPANQDPLTVT